MSERTSERFSKMAVLLQSSEKSNIAQQISGLRDIGQVPTLTHAVLVKFPNTTLLSRVEYIVALAFGVLFL